jgi:hypothetical protein
MDPKLPCSHCYWLVAVPQLAKSHSELRHYATTDACRHRLSRHQPSPETPDQTYVTASSFKFVDVGILSDETTGLLVGPRQRGRSRVSVPQDS